MYGSLAGNIIGTLYFLIFQAAGIFIAYRLLNEEENNLLKLVLGSAFGSFLLHWCPIITSFVFDFTVISHLVALVLLFAVLLVVVKYTPKRKFTGLKEPVKEEAVFLGIFAVFFIYFIATVSTHTIPVENGAMHTGQCTYGDMNMHLGFITSLAVQGTFPPDYSILPGTKLCYPFLSDAISSSVYVFGASLRWSYMLPMFFAVAQAFGGFYCLARTWLKDKAKAIFAWILFFINGGFGFFYFIDKSFNDSNVFKRIFTDFYQTPTNLNENNIRWSNTIVDMLIPQRATLFGWAMLFTCLVLLYKAVFEKKKNYFLPAGIMIGGLPMIHTHSFMVMGIVCAGWMLYSLMNVKAVEEEEKSKIAKYIAGGGLALMCVLQFVWFKNDKPEKLFMGLCIAVVVALFAYGIYLFVKNITGKNNRSKELFSTWGVLLGIVVLFAVPQLLTWTFQQVSNGTFLKGQFNWVNEMDNYIWFYVKNIGVTALLAFPALCYCKKKNFGIVSPALIIWFVAEMMVFQPNYYDNNKLLYGAYALLCCLAANYGVDALRSLKDVGGQRIIAVVTLMVCMTSGVLTMGREYVSDYELYGMNQLKLCEYIENNVEPDAMILTNQRHNNAVAALTGRNIVCGASTFLYFHGVNYQERENDVKKMYNQPAESTAIYEKYGVDYVLVGPDERHSFEQLDENTIASMFTKVFSSGDVTLYKVK